MKYLIVIFYLLSNTKVINCDDSSVDWGYEGDNGPHNWKGKCKGTQRQSPIDIRSTDIDFGIFSQLEFGNYDIHGDIELENNGKTLYADGFTKWGKKQPYIEYGGLDDRYNLEQFHMHWGQNDSYGSEHAIGSLHYPAELHLVHVKDGLSLAEAAKQPDGLAVVGVFLTTMKNRDGRKFDAISDKLDSVVYEGNKTTITNFTPRNMLPRHTEAFYRYEGSLTTPLCNEAVVWTLLVEPMEILEEQLIKLRQLHSKEQRKAELNYRPLQEMNGRRVVYRAHRAKFITDYSSYVMYHVSIVSTIFVFNF